MCGIAGYIGKENISLSTINHTLSLMVNRGPDFQDYKNFYNRDANVHLLHSRLSILDLDVRSNQPFTLHDCTLVFNGEIYNYIELKMELEKEGIQCKTNSDTEVLLRYYLKYGEGCVNKFEGMWAFAIWDNRNKILFLSRDRFAEKPLFMLETTTGTYFASEIKFIKELYGKTIRINDKYLINYLVKGYKCINKTAQTFYEGIIKVEYATNITINTSLAHNKYRYWRFRYVPDQSMCQEDVINETRRLLIESVKIRLRSDVPIAFCLSGGVDSAALASIAVKELGHKINTFSIIDSDERYNEIENIKATVDDLNCENHLIKLDFEGMENRLRKLIHYHDGPISTISYLIHSLLSEAISKTGFKIAISGTGADELFTGYYDHHLLFLNDMKNSSSYTQHRASWLEYIQPNIRNKLLRDSELYFHNPSYRDHIFEGFDEYNGMLNTSIARDFQEEYYSESNLRNRMFNELFHEVIPTILHEDDLNSMYNSIENRSPYLDTRLFEFSCTIPNKYLIKNGFTKYVLREAMKGILNEEVRLDRMKKGFNASIESLFDFRSGVLIKNLFDVRDNKLSEIIRINDVKDMIKVPKLNNRIGKFIFNLINVECFLSEDAYV